jgi:CDP-glucose 4,6-dehydratase
MEFKRSLENMEMIFNNIYKNKKVLITGHTGFKGTWLTLWLHKLGARIYGISKDIPTSPSFFESLNITDDISDYRMDITNFQYLYKTVEDIKPDFIFHLAAQAIVSESYKNPLETIHTNTIGTSNVLESLRLLNFPCTAVIITSDKCYHNVEWVWGYKETDRIGGKDIYSGSKAAAEILFQSYFYSFFNSPSSNIKTATARAGNVIGGGDWAANRIVPDCIRAWTKNCPVEIRNPGSTRPWQHVLEPLSGYLLLGQMLFENSKFSGENYNFGPSSSSSYSVEKLIADLSQFWKFITFAEAFHFKENNDFHEAGLLKLNCDKVFNHLKWLPTLDYNQTVEFTGQWYNEFYKDKSRINEFSMTQIVNYVQIALNQKQVWIK